MPLRIPIGIDDFRDLREQKLEYVDKSHLITQFIDQVGRKVLLLPRPRRFGKTINLTMLRWFFEKRDENLWHLFDDLHVARAGERYRAQFQQYPVIHISFKGCKARTYDECKHQIRTVLRAMYEAHWPVLEGKLEPWNDADCRAILNGTAVEGLYRGSLDRLTKFLHQVHGKRPIVLIDEYDASIHAGYAYGYYDDVVDFFRQFLELGLKDNTHLDRAVMTGILRIAKESIFSGFNNPGVFTILQPEFNTCFGFTEPEVLALLEKAGIPEAMEPLRAYYNGYEFGGVAVYNPWSILEFLASESKQFLHYWVNSSENALIKQLLQRHAFAVEKDIHTLLAGGTIEKKLDDNIVFAELETNDDALWNMLVFCGYLKAAHQGPIVMGDRPPYLLSIPNREVVEVYRTTFHAWMNKGLLAEGGALKVLIAALLDGDATALQGQLEPLCAYMLSYHDLGGPDPERFYHGLMIGLLATLEPDYEVRSNRESGEGRPDVLIKPRRPGSPGVVLELKAARKGERTIKQALNEGLRQLQVNDYASELRAAGVEKIHSMVIAFDGKNVIVVSGDEPAKKKKKVAAKKMGAAAKKRRRAS